MCFIQSQLVFDKMPDLFKMHRQAVLFSVLLTILFSLFPLSCSLPLSTNGRWIVDAKSGKRVKLSCVSWPGHMNTMVPEGLDAQPVANIAAMLNKYEINCVRLTFATYMFTRYGNTVTNKVFGDLGLVDIGEEIGLKNSQIYVKNVIQVFEAVVDELGKHNIMVVLDNHVSEPKWCCSNDTDGNSFFGDTYFDPKEWVQGLEKAAEHFKDKSQVIGISMRNELRGYRQNELDWYKYVPKGAKAIHKINPNLLVIIGGLSWANDLTFLKKRPLDINLGKQLVFEGHWYSFSTKPNQLWEMQPTNRICAKACKWFDDQNAFVIYGDNPIPLFLSEFGFDQRMTNPNDNKFVSCFLSYVLERDMDWALWALQGRYYLREGKPLLEETFGLLNFNWTGLRNPTFTKRFRLMQRMLRDPFSHMTVSYILFHPQSGNCVQVNEKNELYLDDCVTFSRWNHGEDGTPISLLGSGMCLKAGTFGQPPLLSDDCLCPESSWTAVSESKLHLAAMDQRGEFLCLERKDNSSQIVTNKCICIGDDTNCLEDPQTQWFKLIPTNMK